MRQEKIIKAANMNASPVWFLLPVAVAFVATVSLTVMAKPVSSIAADIEVGFSPAGSAERLVLKAINGAKASIRLAGYSFTSASVVRALVEAKKRGVDVAVVVDEKQNQDKNNNGKSQSALSTLSNAGITVRTISLFPIQHSKYIVIDGNSVETGSFNFSKAAAQSNSENVIVVWNRPAIAAAYLNNWTHLFENGKPFQERY
jgi:phosphatidylserine/phosphatidylglycerophosphate/cardiolipin synthase-like enzyme